MAEATQLAIYKRYKETSNTKGTTDTKVSVPVLEYCSSPSPHRSPSFHGATEFF